MALNASRSASRLSRQALRVCSRTQLHNRPSVVAAFSTTPASLADASSATEQDLPRWAHTPRAMKAPFSPHVTKDPARSVWKVNEDPKKLDNALGNFFGREGDRMLPDELKWLAVTHKSFDQGRRGFNDRLAFLGRQICTFEATQAIITSAPTFAEPENDPYAGRRTPYEDPALRSLDNLTQKQPSDIFSHDKLTALAVETGLSDVVRWKPRMPENVIGSGFNIIMSGTIYALVGAVAQQHGGKVASRVVRERIMKKLRL